MSDNLNLRGPQDASKINTHEPYELRDWSKRLGITPEVLIHAVGQVGVSAVKVREYLGK
jgi:Protein of unknown function (DUF3606)